MMNVLKAFWFLCLTVQHIQLTGHQSTAPTLKKSRKYILRAVSSKSLDVISHHQAEKEVSVKSQRVQDLKVISAIHTS